jgi:hypothetical protein
MKKGIIILLLTGFFFSCKTKPHLSFKMKSEKIADGCSNVSHAFHMESNFAGERFEWEACLPSGQGHEGVTLEQKGDTVLVHMPAQGAAPAHFSLTLDVDAYPAYHFITVGDETYLIAAAKN